jgi:hypothetical protein
VSEWVTRRPAAQTLNGFITGASGQPIGDATVLVYSAGVRTGYSLFCPTCYVDCGKRTTTDGAGRFTIAGLDDELRFNLLVVKDGFAPAWIRTADPQKSEVISAVLQPRQPIADLRRVLSGRIVDRQGQRVATAMSEITALRAEREQLQASIEDLNRRGAKISLKSCGPGKRLCVLVDQSAGRFGEPKSGDIYMIAKGY